MDTPAAQRDDGRPHPIPLLLRTQNVEVRDIQEDLCSVEEGAESGHESRYPRWTSRRRESDEVNMRKNEEMFAEVIGALPETKRQQVVEAEWSTAGGKVKIIAQVLGFLVLVNVVGNFLINIPKVNRFVRSSGDGSNY